MNTAKSEHKEYYEDLFEELKPQVKAPSIDEGICSHWLNLIILSLSELNEFAIDVSVIEKSLIEEVPQHFITESLKSLVKYGVLSEVSTGKYVLSSTEKISTPNDTALKSTHSYYEQVLEKAKSAIKIDLSEREFQYFSMGMNQGDLIKVKNILRKTREDIAKLSSSNANRVYQFNLNGFPVAQTER